MLDEPAPEELPSSDVREEARPADPFDPARVFSAFTTNPVTTVAALNGVAATVFAPREPEPAVADAIATEPGAQEPRRGRILPSLLPLNRFDADKEGEDGSSAPKPRRPKRSLSAPKSNETETIAEVPVPEVASDDQPSGTEVVNQRRLRRRQRVPAQDRWKRRRLPEACW